MNGIIDDSPATLESGRWVPGKHGIQRWVPDLPPLALVPEPPPDPTLIACPTCRCGINEPCRTASGRPAGREHKDRLVPRPRVCRCGNDLPKPVGHARNIAYCTQECREEGRRDQWRAYYDQNRRAS